MTGETMQGGLTTAFGMAYMITESGRLLEVHQESLRRGREWLALGAGEGFPSCPVILDQRVFVYSTRSLEMFHLRGGDCEWRYSLDPPWKIRDESLTAGPGFIAFESYIPDGDGWRLHVFRWERSRPPEHAWSYDLQGGVPTIPVIARNHIVLMTRDGGAYVFNPLAGPEPISHNERSCAAGFRPAIHPLADDDWIVAIASNDSAGYSQSIVDFNMSRPSLRARQVATLENQIVESLVRTPHGFVATLGSGFTVWSRHGNKIFESRNPADLTHEPPLVLGSILVLAAANHGRLFPYRLGESSVDNGEPYPAERGPSPYLSVVPGHDGLLALRRDGVLENISVS